MAITVSKLGVFVAAFGILGITMYPIVIEPIINVDKYKEIQKRNRQGINQEDVQPGNMRVWRDPFDRK